MVSRVYVPPVLPYSRPQGTNSFRGPVASPTENPSAGKGEQVLREGENSDLQQRPSSGLQAVQYNANQKIPLDAVIGDFKNTMSALGADEQTRSEVTAYLNVVRLQAGKDQPEVPYIRQTLKTAANSLDQFISKALGQPSQVVKEWVDALLLQNIDYKATLPLDHPSDSEHKPATSADAIPVSKEGSGEDAPDELTEPSATPSANALPASTKTQVKSLIEAAKAERLAGNPQQADQKLQDALALLKDANRPDWEGKVWRMRGRTLDQSGQWEQAVQAYQQSAHSFETAKQPQRQAQALQAMASILEEHGQLTPAKAAYRQVVALDRQSGEVQNQARSLNDLAGVLLKQGDSRQAVRALQKASTLAESPNVQPEVRSDILSNLGAAHHQAQNYDQAVQSYQQSLQAAQEARDKNRYTSALQHLASVYTQSNQPDQAMAILQRLKSMADSSV
jgi:tetratricopeptide (TPR) repeat protein